MTEHRAPGWMRDFVGSVVEMWQRFGAIHWSLRSILIALVLLPTFVLCVALGFRNENIRSLLTLAMVAGFFFILGAIADFPAHVQFGLLFIAVIEVAVFGFMVANLNSMRIKTAEYEANLARSHTEPVSGTNVPPNEVSGSLPSRPTR